MVRMASTDGSVWSFDPGALCLEFLLTGGPGELSRWESLHEPADLAAWAAQRFHLDATVTPAELDDARRLRSALWQVLGDRTDLYGIVNEAAARPPLAPRIAPDGTRGWAVPATGGQVVSTLARDAADLLTGPLADRIRECGADNCPLIFVDTSRPGQRRWCSMQRCGNRAKVRLHRGG